MRKIRELLQLKWADGCSNREVAKSLAISPTAVCNCVQRAERAGLSWPLDPELEDAKLELLLYPPAKPGSGPRPLPDWSLVHCELRRKDVTLQRLWQEYRERYPKDGLGYSQFCDRYRRYRSKLNVVMRQVHRAGEKMFVDFSGDNISIIDRDTGELTETQLFVAVLGASSYTYAEALLSQKLRDWIEAHAHAYEFFGGVPQITVPDNLKSAVTRPCRYDPLLNATYLEMARHYGTIIIPARPRKPRDKAKVEAAVLLAQRWILAALRHQRFFSLDQANEAILEKLGELNQRRFQKLNTTRQELFESLDQPALGTLPSRRYEYAEWTRARVNIDYHIELDKSYYSVPYSLVHELVDVRKTMRTIEVFLGGKRIASHLRNTHPRAYSTLPEHMPRSHREHLQWSPSRMKSWARKIGSATALLIENILESRPHPEQGYRSCLGILRLAKSYGNDRLEAAARRGIVTGANSYRSIQSILANGLDRQPLPPRTSPPSTTLAQHPNVRGKDSYH